MTSLLRHFLLPALAAALALWAIPGVALADILRLTNDQLYSLAAFTEAEQEALLEEISRGNPDLVLSDLSREGGGVRISMGSRGHLEFLPNELYSLAVYIPTGIEADISRRSSAHLRVGRITRDALGVSFFLGSSAANGLAARDRGEGQRVAGSPADPGPEPIPEQRGSGGNDPPAIATAPSGGGPGKVPMAVPADNTGSGPVLAENVTVPVDPARGKASGSPMPGDGGAEIPVPVVDGRGPGPGPVNETAREAGSEPSRQDFASGRRLPTPERYGVNELVIHKARGPAPILDGKGDDSAWAAAGRTRIRVGPDGRLVEAAAVTLSDKAYFMFTWEEPDPEFEDQPWIWDRERERYVRSGSRDDGVAVWWGRKGKPLNPGGSTETWDLWTWRAGREGLGEHASDGTVSVSREPLHMATYEAGRGRGVRWTRQEFDRGRLPYEIVIPFSFSGPQVGSYAAGKPDDSASDVQAAGAWSEGKWVVEMARELTTGHDDDFPFKRDQDHAFVLSLLGEGELATSPASGVLTIIWDDPM